MELYLEILGYIGTALVIFSMTMTSVTKLRFFNICGSVLSTVYAIAGHAWPIVIMNVCLMAINLFHLIRGLCKREIPICVRLSANDATVRHLLSQDRGGEAQAETLDDGEATVVYVDDRAVAVCVGRKEGETLALKALRVDPKQGVSALQGQLFPLWREEGIRKLTLPIGAVPKRVDKRLGLSECDGVLIREI